MGGTNQWSILARCPLNNHLPDLLFELVSRLPHTIADLGSMVQRRVRVFQPTNAVLGKRFEGKVGSGKQHQLRFGSRHHGGRATHGQPGSGSYGAQGKRKLHGVVGSHGIYSSAQGCKVTDSVRMRTVQFKFPSPPKKNVSFFLCQI